MTIKALLISAVLLLPFSQAQASLIGDTVNCGVQPSILWGCVPQTGNVVGAGPEYILDLGNPGLARSDMFEIDLGASSIAMNFISAIGGDWGAGELLTLSGLDWVGFPNGAITGIANFSTDATSGIDASDVTFGAHMIQINFHASSWNPQQSLSFDLIVDHGDVSVPAPATLALFGLGLAGLGWARRKKA